MKALRTALKYLFITVAWLGLWWGISAAVGNEVILPSPIEVFLRAGELAVLPKFWLSIAFSFVRVIFGVVCATVASILLAATAFKWRTVYDIIKPVATVIKATPVVSFIFIAFIIFRNNFDALPAFISGLIVFPVMYESIHASLKATPTELIEVSQVFGCTFYERVRYLWVPSVLPNFITSSKTSIGLAWKSGIAAEALVAIPTLISIGTEVSEAKRWLETLDQFVWTLTVIILSLLSELLFSFIAKKITDKIL